jgi:glucokinase
MSRDLYAGIDLGGTKILTAIVSPAGKILARAKRDTPFENGAPALLAALSGTLEEALASARATSERLIAIGMGSPGPLDLANGILLRTPNIGVRRVRFRDHMERQFAVPLVLDNDVHMAVFGEMHAGAGRGVRDVIGIWVGTGVGGCVILDGRVVHGANQNAGEIGHMILDAKKSSPGKPRGGLEWEASKTGIVRHLRKAIRRGEKTMLAKYLGRHERLHSSHLAAAWSEGDEPTRAALERSARYVGIAMANLFNVFAPELFILGGGVVEDVGAPYVRMAASVAARCAFSTELAKIRVVASRLKGDAGVLGAALAAREQHSVPAIPA